MKRAYALGCLRDYADLRDVPVKELKGKLIFAAKPLPQFVDFRDLDSPIEDQGSLGSCTAMAAVGALEYLIKKNKKDYKDLSKLFLYKISRDSMGLTGDTGASLRHTVKCLKKFGVCPEALWPYKVSSFEKKPTLKMFESAEKNQVLGYYKNYKLEDIKWSLAEGYPVILGFPVYEHSFDPGPSGRIELPGKQGVRGGHAICLVGYDDSKGAFFFRNSWGSTWGNNGYGELVFEYVTEKLAEDIWTITDVEAG